MTIIKIPQGFLKYSLAVGLISALSACGGGGGSSGGGIVIASSSTPVAVGTSSVSSLNKCGEQRQQQKSGC